jgi:hypothetical protein
MFRRLLFLIAIVTSLSTDLIVVNTQFNTRSNSSQTMSFTLISLPVSTLGN